MSHENEERRPFNPQRPWVNTAIVLSIAPAATIAVPVNLSSGQQELEGGSKDAAPIGELDRGPEDDSDE